MERRVHTVRSKVSTYTYSEWSEVHTTVYYLLHTTNTKTPFVCVVYVQVLYGCSCGGRWNQVQGEGGTGPSTRGTLCRSRVTKEQLGPNSGTLGRTHSYFGTGLMVLYYSLAR